MYLKHINMQIVHAFKYSKQSCLHTRDTQKVEQRLPDIKSFEAGNGKHEEQSGSKNCL